MPREAPRDLPGTLQGPRQAYFGIDFSIDFASILVQCWVAFLVFFVASVRPGGVRGAFE